MTKPLCPSKGMKSFQLGSRLALNGSKVMVGLVICLGATV